MLLILLKQSLLNQKRSMAVMIVSVAVGTALAASLLTLSLDISAKVSKELRSFGANIVVRPKVSELAGLAGQQRFLREADIVKAKAVIFWRHNIIGIAPVLEVQDEASGIPVLGTWYGHSLPVPGEERPFVTGMDSVMPWWTVEGSWPRNDQEVLAGGVIAAERGMHIGDAVTLRGRQLLVSGILQTGGREEGMLVGNLALVQDLFHLPGRVTLVLVSAFTTPMDAFAYKDPKTMTQKEYEKWYCTGYVTSIAKQLEEAFAGSSAGPVWPVAESEGQVLARLEMLVALLVALSLCAAALSVSTTMIVSVLRRTEEVALMKAIGAGSGSTALIFLAEAALAGTAGGGAGYVLSLGLTDYLGQAVFGASLEQKIILLPVCTVIAVLIAMLGVFLPVRRALLIKPAVALKGAQ
ncbi:MAG: ABC transporter permease [Nitrospirota bacterium]